MHPDFVLQPVVGGFLLSFRRLEKLVFSNRVIPTAPSPKSAFTPLDRGLNQVAKGINPSSVARSSGSKYGLVK
jgi:hypothetical protein